MLDKSKLKANMKVDNKTLKELMSHDWQTFRTGLIRFKTNPIKACSKPNLTINKDTI